MSEKNKSLIIPCKEEGDEFVTIVTRFKNYIKEDTEILVVVDDESDVTVKKINQSNLDINILINPYEPGPANAVRYGIENSLGSSVCVAMGDGSDDPRQVEDLFLLIERGLSIAVASRYTKTGSYIGKKGLKYILVNTQEFFYIIFLELVLKTLQTCLKLMIKNF